MRRLALLVALSSAGCHEWSSLSSTYESYEEVVLETNGLVSLWQLDETAGSTARDAHGANDGAYSGGVRLGEPGLAREDEGAARFDGQDDHVLVPSAASLNVQSFTLEAWVRIDALPAPGKAASVMNAFRFSCCSAAASAACAGSTARSGVARHSRAIAAMPPASSPSGAPPATMPAAGCDR